MAIRGYKPTTPSRRQMTVATFEEVTRSIPEKSLTVNLNTTAGRNAHGRMEKGTKEGGRRE